MARLSIFTAAVIGAAMAAPSAQAGPDEYLGEIITVGFNFCPRGTMEADGRLLPIAQNTALFSLLGTLYGGDGRTTFALPDLRGRVIVGDEAGPGLTHRVIGEKGGVENDSANVPVLAGDGSNNAPGSSSTGQNMQPYLVMKRCVVTQGMFPSRS
ncbi:MAG: tail fiber protein [Pseudomonadota bacterium]|nr:tail fiber protein [Pseudomonadota bacterium]